MAMGYDKPHAICSFGVALCVLSGWGYLMARSGGWIRKENPAYRIEAGLFNVTSQSGVDYKQGSEYSLVSPEADEILRNLHRGSYGMQEWKEYICRRTTGVIGLGGVCHTWSAIAVAASSLSRSVTVALVTMLIACFFDMYHFFKSFKPRQRKLVRIGFSMVPIMLSFALIQFQIMASALQAMPPVYLSDKDGKSDPESVMGNNVQVGWVLCALSTLPFLMIAWNGGYSNEREEFTSKKAFLRKAGALNSKRYGGKHQDVDYFKAPDPVPQKSGIYDDALGVLSAPGHLNTRKDRRLTVTTASGLQVQSPDFAPPDALGMERINNSAIRKSLFGDAAYFSD